MNEISVRPARPDDWPSIVEFNTSLAEETEGKRLDPRRIRPGVRAVLADPGKGRYFVACRDENIVGQLMHTREWSDWRNGEIWWLQSVYVSPEYRRCGVFRKLYEHARNAAADEPDVVGLRLYVENENRRAQQTYGRLGLRPAGYLVMEEMFEDA